MEKYILISELDFTKYKENKCPTCQKIALYVCNCTYKEKRCENNHIWYNKEGKNIKGNPHEKEASELGFFPNLI